MKIFCALTVLLASVLLLGCGPSGPETYTVSGTVTFDEESIVEGDIIFRDATGQGKSYAGKILDGNYSCEVEPGSKKVEITAMRETGEMDTTSNPGEESAELEMYIPAKYNSETTLTEEVDSAKTINFPLTSK